MSAKVVRIIAFFVSIFSVIVLPWWISVFVLIFFTVFFSAYYEALFFGFLVDLLYSTSFIFPYVGLISATIFLSLVIFIKNRIRT